MNTIKERLENHGAKLLVLFPHALERDPVRLCKKLWRHENKASENSTDYCNGRVSFDVCEAVNNRILRDVNRLLQNTEVPVFINGDPRGYALKVDDAWMRRNNADLCRDWGGYGVIAPDLSEG